jgi:acyl-[acyl-carrier-protein] desaturase
VCTEGMVAMTTTLDSARLLAVLEPTVTENLNRHLATAKEWMPHELGPWCQGREFADLGGVPWSLEQSNLSPIARTALEVNLLTEDNLPSYHREVERAFGRDSAWGTWVNRWTAEEGRHAYCIRDYLLVIRGEHLRVVAPDRELISRLGESGPCAAEGRRRAGARRRPPT